MELGGGVLDKVIPEPVERDKAKAELLKQQQAGELKELEACMDAIVAEAKRKSKLTSVAQPMFLYVMYVIILSPLIIASFYVFYPDETKLAIEGMKLWLNSIPTDMWTLFGFYYLIYIKNRSAAQPMFLCIMYVIILAPLIIAPFYVFYPDETDLAKEGMRLWLNSIPTDMWTLIRFLLSKLHN